MKKRKSELIKVQNIIENNRIKTEGNFIDLVATDVTKLLKDYFVFNKEPKIEITKEVGQYFVTINLPILRVKNFTTIPR